MQIGVSMWSYFQSWKKGMDLPGFIRAAKEAGAEGVELLDFFYNEPDGDRILWFSQDWVTKKQAAAKQTLAEVGLPVPIFSVANNFAKHDENEREQEVQKIVFGVDQALDYGAKVVRVFAGDVNADVNFEQARAYIVRGLAEASQYADAKGIRLALENHGTLAGRSDQVCGLIEDVRAMSGNDALGANPDTGNFMVVGQASHEAIRDVAKYAYMVHFKDFKTAPAGYTGPGCPTLQGGMLIGTAVGEGEVDLEQCIAILRDAGFNGWLSVEYEGDEDPMTAVPRCLANAKRYL